MTERPDGTTPMGTSGGPASRRGYGLSASFAPGDPYGPAANSLLPQDCDFYQTLLNSLSLHTAVLAESGDIVAVNDAWQRYADQNGHVYAACTGVTAHDLHICRCALGEDDHTAQEVLAGIKGVLSGRLPHFEREYACYLPGKTDWFHMFVNPFVSGDYKGAVVSHMNITERVRAEEKNEQLLAELIDTTEQLATTNRRLRGLTRQVIRVQEEERQRLSRILHDDVGQILTVLKYRLELLQDEPVVLSADSGERLRAATLLCQSAIDHARIVAHELRPSALEDLGLVPAMAALCDEFSIPERFVIAFQSAKLTTWPEDVELACYRCLQEALTNALKHAQATEVKVRLEETSAALTLTVQDNGCGFEVGQFSSKAERLGLLGMRERLEAVGGCLEIRSAPGAGTTLEARVPVAPTSYSLSTFAGQRRARTEDETNSDCAG